MSYADPADELWCAFCEIAAGRAPATIVREWPDALAIVPRNPVVDGHVLVIPRKHIAYPDQDPQVAGMAATRAAEWAWRQANGLPSQTDYNLIVNAGPNASQTVYHLHWHYVPRRPEDGLTLPWTGQPR